MDFISGLLGAGANLLGGLLGKSSAEKQAEANRAAQYDFAQHGIQWKVADARAAGINPLAALGAPTSSFSNVAGDDSFGSSIGRSGQDLSRAALALASKEPTRMELLNQQLLEAKIANVNADTVRMAALASRMATNAQPGSPPGIPIPQPHPIRTNWDLNLAKPAYENFVVAPGSMTSAPTQEYAQATESMAGIPSAVVGGGQSIIENLKHGVKAVGGQISGWIPARGDVWRGVDRSQYLPF